MSSTADLSAAGWHASTLAAAEGYDNQHGDSEFTMQTSVPGQEGRTTEDGQPVASDGIDSAADRAADAFYHHDPNRPATPQVPAGSGAPGGDGVDAPVWLPTVDNVVVTVAPPSDSEPSGSSVPLPSLADAGPTAAPDSPSLPSQPSVPTSTEVPVTIEEPASARQAPKIVSGLGQKIDDIINLSPTLRNQWAALKAQRWQLVVDEGGGSRVEWSKTKIYLDPKMSDNPHLLAAMVSHEIGHAANPPDFVPAKGITKEEFVERNTELSLAAEGAAAFENARHSDEIAQNGGADVGIAGKNADGPYLEIYEAWTRGEISESDAKRQMGDLMANELADRNGTTMREHFTAEWDAKWDRNHSDVPDGSPAHE